MIVVRGAADPQRRDYATEVLDVVDAVPPGRVLTYGDVADLLGWGHARAVGAALARHGGAVPWWRIVRVDGTLATPLLARAAPHWAQEGTPRRSDGLGVELAAARWHEADGGARAGGR